MAFLGGSSCGLALKYHLDSKTVTGNKLGHGLRTALFGLRSGIFSGHWCRCLIICELQMLQLEALLEIITQGQINNCDVRQLEASFSVSEIVFF